MNGVIRTEDVNEIFQEAFFLEGRTFLYNIALAAQEVFFRDDRFLSNLFAPFPFDWRKGAVNGVQAWDARDAGHLGTVLQSYFTGVGESLIWTTHNDYANPPKKVVDGPYGLRSFPSVLQETAERYQLSQSKQRAKGIWTDGDTKNRMRIRIPHK